jgi:hypothetical protein
MSSLNCRNDESGKARERKPLGVKPSSATPRHLGVEPTQMQPHVLKEEAQANQQKTQRRILGGGSGSDPTGAGQIHRESACAARDIEPGQG